MNKALKAAPANGTYIVPVVFHVFGTDFQGHTIDDDVVQSALDLANTDFNGLNNDYSTVDDEFLDRRGTLNIQFKLAKIDPWGNACSGINYYPYPVKGFGNGGGYDDEIQKYAWDNYKYFNIYIMVDLYDNGVTNNSGVCWYPDTYMSDLGLARMVF
ncbi:MAG: hypothetical protein HC831_06955 [Chloroflexia bacterium]|nr:hypothetical protein [Chloroflexia bacterium]